MSCHLCSNPRGWVRLHGSVPWVCVTHQEKSELEPSLSDSSLIWVTSELIWRYRVQDTRVESKGLSVALGPTDQRIC